MSEHSIQPSAVGEDVADDFGTPFADPQLRRIELETDILAENKETRKLLVGRLSQISVA